MEKLSTSQMRQNGLTAFEAELVNYILTNEISEGTTFKGVPGHPRYGASKEELLRSVSTSDSNAAAPSINNRAAVVDVEPLQAVEILDTLDVAPVAPMHPIL